MDVDAQALETRGRSRMNLHPEHTKNILVVQTAFLGDVILTLPMIQTLHRQLPSANIDVVVIPQAVGLLANHPAIHEVISYDKHSYGGIATYFRLRKKLRVAEYDLAIVPHRSLRSALIAQGAHISKRIGFDNSSSPGRFTLLARYRADLHESRRNLSLLEPLGIHEPASVLPELYPSSADLLAVDQWMQKWGIHPSRALIAIAPGSVWNTKRWLKDRFAVVAKELSGAGHDVVLVGGADDVALCQEITSTAKSERIFNCAGIFSLLQSAYLIKRCRVLLSNDSAPMHIAVAVRTPVVAVFGATSPAYGFAPYGPSDVVVETNGLACRPCAIHGGNACPIGTFDCMKRITSEAVLGVIQRKLSRAGTGN